MSDAATMKELIGELLQDLAICQQRYAALWERHERGKIAARECLTNLDEARQVANEMYNTACDLSDDRLMPLDARANPYKWLKREPLNVDEGS